MKIDFHSHYFPLSYVKALEKRSEWPIVKTDEKGKLHFFYDATRSTPLNDSFYDIEQRMKEMDEGQIEMAVLSVSNPLVLSLSELINNEMGKVMKEFPDRFVCFAVLPYIDIPKALKEMDRAVKDLNLKGLMMPSNIEGESVDSPKFFPLYEKAAKLGVPILIHPVMTGNKNMLQYMLETTIGFPFETSLALSKLIFSGVLEKFPKLKIILAHAGGAIPYLIGRIDRACEAFNLGTNLSKAPSKYLNQVYVDTICFKHETLLFAKEILGSNNLVFGTDVPFGWNTLTDFVEFVERSPLSEKEKEKIFGTNAARILNL